jgi:hypothetical protein
MPTSSGSGSTARSARDDVRSRAAPSPWPALPVDGWAGTRDTVSSCGYWPGPPGEEGVFYSYAYPEPAGCREITGLPEGARWDDGLGGFVLPYEAVRTAADPDAMLLAFLQRTYEAAADLAGWDRPALERDDAAPAEPTGLPNGAGPGGGAGTADTTTS